MYLYIYTAQIDSDRNVKEQNDQDNDIADQKVAEHN